MIDRNGVRVFVTPHSMADSIGEDLGVSQWHEVTQTQVDLFADATGDHQWIHVDMARASEGPYGGTIAHGYLSLALIPVLQKEIFRVQGAAMGINYGLDRVRFPAPVRVGGRIRARSQLVDAVITETGLRATTRVTIEVEGSERPACVADAIALYVANRVGAE